LTEQYTAVTKVKLMRMLTMLHAGNSYNKTIQLITLQSGLCRENPLTRKISRE